MASQSKPMPQGQYQPRPQNKDHKAKKQKKQYEKPQNQQSNNASQGQRKRRNRDKYFDKQRPKPSLQQIKQKYPGMIMVPRDITAVVNNQTLNQQLNKAYDYGQKHHFNPRQIHQRLLDKDVQLFPMYQHLRQFATSTKYIAKMKNFIANKMIKQVSLQNKVPMKQALCQIVLDDWFEDLKSLGSNVWQTVKGAYNDHKDNINDVIGNLIQQFIPSAKPIFDGAIQAFGGIESSEDPYCIDVEYVKSVFSSQLASQPAPRFQTHYMFATSTELEIPVTTLVDGTALIVICPNYATAPVYTSNSATLPFISVCSGSSSFPFAATPTYGAPGPFTNLATSFQNFAIDTVVVDFINTQNKLDVQGKFITSMFSEAPNASWVKTASNLYTTSSIFINDAQLLNDTGYFKRFANAQCQKMTRICTYIIEQNDNQCKPKAYASSVNGSQQRITIIKFTGCKPSSTIGSLFVKVGISVQPVADQRNILKVSPRGSYQGVFRCFKQCRKLGIPLQFLNYQQASFLFKSNYRQIDFQSFHKYGAGFCQIPKNFKVVFNPTDNGACVQKCFQYLGIQNNLPPTWATLSEVKKFTDKYILCSSGLVIKSGSNYYSGQNVLCFDVKQKHCCIVKYIGQTKTINTYLSQYLKHQNPSTPTIVNQGDQFIYKNSISTAPQIIEFPIHFGSMPNSLYRSIADSSLLYDRQSSNFVANSQTLVDKNLFNQWVYGWNAKFKSINGKIFISFYDTTIQIIQNATLSSLGKICGIVFRTDGLQALQDQIVSNQVYDSNFHKSSFLIEIELQTIQKNPGPCKFRSRLNKRNMKWKYALDQLKRSSLQQLYHQKCLDVDPQAWQLSMPCNDYRTLYYSLKRRQLSNARRMFQRYQREPAVIITPQFDQCWACDTTFPYGSKCNCSNIQADNQYQSDIYQQSDNVFAAQQAYQYQQNHPDMQIQYQQIPVTQIQDESSPTYLTKIHLQTIAKNPGPSKYFIDICLRTIQKNPGPKCVKQQSPRKTSVQKTKQISERRQIRNAIKMSFLSRGKQIPQMSSSEFQQIAAAESEDDIDG